MRTTLRRISMALVAAAVGTAALVAVAPPTSAEGPVAYTVTTTVGAACQLVRVDLASGATTTLPASSSDACVTDLAVAPDGTVYGTLPGKPFALLIRFDTTTGAATNLGPFTGSFTESFVDDGGGLAFDKLGNLLVQLVTDEVGCDGDYVCLYRVDPTTLAATFIGNSGAFRTSFSYLAADCAGSLKTLMFGDANPDAQDTTSTTADPALDPAAAGTPAPDAATDQAASDWPEVNGQAIPNSLITIDPATGQASPLAVPLPDGQELSGIDYDKATGTLYLLAGDFATAVDATIYTVDTTTGNITPVADLDPGDFFVDTLAIAGTCGTLELQPRFTG